MHIVLFFLHFLLYSFGGSSFHETAPIDYSFTISHRMFSIHGEAFYAFDGDSKHASIQDLPFEIEEELQGQDDDRDSRPTLCYYDHKSATSSICFNFWFHSLNSIHAVNFIYFLKFCSTTSPIYILQRVLRL